MNLQVCPNISERSTIGGDQMTKIYRCLWMLITKKHWNLSTISRVGDRRKEQPGPRRLTKIRMAHIFFW